MDVEQEYGAAWAVVFGGVVDPDAVTAEAPGLFGLALFFSGLALVHWADLHDPVLHVQVHLALAAAFLEVAGSDAATAVAESPLLLADATILVLARFSLGLVPELMVEF